jgi:hypothetical protein
MLWPVWREKRKSRAMEAGESSKMEKIVLET